MMKNLDERDFGDDTLPQIRIFEGKERLKGGPKPGKSFTSTNEFAQPIASTNCSSLKIFGTQWSSFNNWRYY